MTTTNLGLNLPAQGDPAVRNNWANAVCIPDYEILDAYTSQPITKSVAGGTNTVLTMGSGSVGEAQHTHFVFNGVLTGSKYVLFPAGNSFKFTAENQTTGAFTLSIGADDGSGMPAGSTVVLVSGSDIVEFFSDGTDVNAITSSLPTISNGKMLANESGSSAPATATDIPTLQIQKFTSSGTFTVPSNANSNTVFKFTVVGGGGGGGGAATNSSFSFSAGGGGSGGAIEGFFKGFPASDSVTITVGSGGSPGSSSGSNGGTGGQSSITYSAVNLLVSNGGAGGRGISNTGTAIGGAAGSTSSSAGSLTLVAAQSLMATPGGVGMSSVSGSNVASGFGGSNPYGSGGISVDANSNTGMNGSAGTFGAGGSGASTRTESHSGGSGGTGIVVVEWVL